MLPRKVDFTPIVGPAFRALRAHGCTAARGVQAYRITAGYDEAAWFPATVILYGTVTIDDARPVLADLGWAGAIKIEN